MSNSTRTGSINELRACSWLMSQGYEAFRNVCQVGPADIIALNTETGEKILIDVKTKSKSKVFIYHKLSSTQKRLGVKVLIVDENGCTLQETGD